MRSVVVWHHGHSSLDWTPPCRSTPSRARAQGGPALHSSALGHARQLTLRPLPLQSPVSPSSPSSSTSNRWQTLCVCGAVASCASRNRCSRNAALSRIPSKAASEDPEQRPGVVRRLWNKARWVLGGKVKDLEERLQAAKDEAVDAEGRANSLQLQLADDLVARKGVERQLAEAQLRIKDMEGKLKSALGKVETLEGELTSKDALFTMAVAREKQTVEDLKLRVGALQTSYTDIQTELEMQQNDNASKDTRIKTLEERLAAVRADLELSRENESSLLTQLQAAEAKVKELLAERVKWAQEQIPQMLGLGASSEGGDAKDPDDEEDKKPEAVYKQAAKARDGLEAALKEVEEAKQKTIELASSAEDKAGATAAKDKAGASAAEDKAGASAAEDKAGASAAEDKAGASAAKDKAGASAAKDKAGSKKPDAKPAQEPQVAEEKPKAEKKEQPSKKTIEEKAAKEDSELRDFLLGWE